VGELIDKAENALIAAGLLFIHQIGFELQTDVIVFFFLNLDGNQIGASMQKKGEVPIYQIKAIVQYVGNIVSVDRNQNIAGADPGFVGKGTAFYRLNGDHKSLLLKFGF
jgi:hypothetical protein